VIGAVLNYANMITSGVDSRMTVLQEFENELVRAWGFFPHQFEMPKARGNATSWVNLANNKKVWSCTSLSDAALQYCWDIVTVQRGKPTSEDLRYQLKQALSRGNNRDLEDVCLKTFDWG
jgi:hypothetical protein